MKKKSLAFMVGISPPLAFAAGNIAVALRKHMPREDYDLIVYYTELTPSDIAVFRSIPRCRLVQYKFPPGFSETLVANSAAAARFKTPHDLMTFVRFEAFGLLAEYRTVVALDADIAIQGSLMDMVQFGPFGITTDAPWTVQNNFTGPIAGYEMTIPGVCAAIMMVQDTLPYQAIHKWCYFKAIQAAPFLVNGDQGIINLMLQEFAIVPNLMPLEIWQCISWRSEAIVAKIVHFGTEKKVWCNANICNAFPEWYRTHREWLRLGGSDFDQARIDPRNILPVLNEYDRLVGAGSMTVA